MGKQDSGVAGIEVPRLLEGGGGFGVLAAPQLSFRQQQPASGICRDELNGQGRQAGGFLGLAKLQQSAGRLGNAQTCGLQVALAGQHHVGHQSLSGAPSEAGQHQGRCGENLQPARSHRCRAIERSA